MYYRRSLNVYLEYILAWRMSRHLLRLTLSYATASNSHQKVPVDVTGYFYFIFLPSNKTELLSCSQWCSLEEEAPCVEESVSVQVCFTCLTLYTERRETDHDRHYDPRQLASDWAGTKKRVLDVSCLVPDCHRDVRIPLTSLYLKASFL